MSTQPNLYETFINDFEFNSQTSLEISFETFSKIFPKSNISANQIIEDEEENQKIYYIFNKSKETEISTSNQISQTIQTNKTNQISQTSQANQIKQVIFKTTKENHANKKLIGKKRGRNPTNQNTKAKNRKYDQDDILTKIQVHYISYIINFLNKVSSALGIKEEFKEIKYSLKKNVSYEYFTQLQGKTLKDIVSMETSNKYSKFGKEHNKDLCESIDNKVVQNILSKKYLEFFQNYYYKDVKEINLKEFGFGGDEKVILSHKGKEKALTYQDKIDCFKNDKLYVELCNKFVMENYHIKNFRTEAILKH